MTNKNYTGIGTILVGAAILIIIAIGINQKKAVSNRTSIETTFGIYTGIVGKITLHSANGIIEFTKGGKKIYITQPAIVEETPQ